jgi:hypothetical protein
MGQVVMKPPYTDNPLTGQWRSEMDKEWTNFFPTEYSSANFATVYRTV